MPAGFDVVTFLSDFGHDDVFVGVCHGVVAARAPRVRIIDLVHTVPPQDVRTGALLLARAVVHLPVAVHLAVVDPGVGTDRRAVVIRAHRGDLLVVPDNGLADPALDMLGGRAGAWELAVPPHASATFHGRDVFAPAAGALAAGARPGDLGSPAAVPPRLTLPASRRHGRTLVAEILLVDRFGNLQLAATPQDLDPLGVGAGDRVAVRCGDRSATARMVDAFGMLAPGELGLYADSDEQLALAVNRGSAATLLAAGSGDEVSVAVP